MTLPRPEPQRLPKHLPGFENIPRSWDRGFGVPMAKIVAGEYYVTDQEEGILTVLGSCISACIRDKIFGIGGMNHFMLPISKNDDDKWVDSCVDPSNRYGNFAMENLINAVIRNGGHREHLEVKIFGGGKVLELGTDIGKRNIEFVKRYLANERLPVIAEDVGDICPRKVVFFPRSGTVKLKRLRRQESAGIAEAETTYLENIDAAPVEGDIDLF
ncbi:MAG: chemoreceptor glutamine deamidase CheD [Planctomycetota bacterium]